MAVSKRVLRIALSAAVISGSFVVPTVSVKAQTPTGTIKAGYGEADATWHVGAGAGQYADKDFDDVVNSVTGGDVDPHGHSIAQHSSYGVQSRLSYRAIVVEDVQGDQVAFVKSDSYLSQDYLLRRAAQILLLKGSDISYDEIFQMASHNHSSPYYMTPSAGVWIFQDAFDIRAFEYHANALAQSIMNAEANMVPARMGATTVTHTLFKGQIQRKDPSDDGTPRGYPNDFGDLGLPVIRFDNMEDPTDPKPMAVLMNWGQHPEGLEGHDLITGDFVAPLERFVERATGAPVVFSQADVGSSEAGPGRPQDVGALGIPARWSHVGHAQGERGAYLLSRSVIEAFNEIEGPTAQVPFSSNFDVKAGNAWVAGPYSHPYPSVSNCRTETTVEGSPAAPGPPECIRAGDPDPSDQTWEQLKEAGVPLPDNYDIPSYAGLEENTRLHLQAFKLGDIIIGSCACEAQVDLILNFETRANNVTGDIWDGFDWTTRMDCAQNADQTWTCRKKADDPRPNSVIGEFTVNDYRYKRMLAQVHNDAAGWDAPENISKAMSEPHDTTKIYGNFTKEELTAATGYKMAIGVGHASDYNGYTVSYREYQSWDDYRKSLTSYGPHTADYMVTRMVRLAGTLNGVPNQQLDIDIARGLPDEARQVAMSTALGGASLAAYTAWTNALPNDKGPAVARTQPDDITRFDGATFSWVGGSNAVDNPIVKVQRQLADGTWVEFADQTGEVQTMVKFPKGTNAFTTTYTGGQEWLWTANFEAFNAFPAEIGSTPEGTYRFVVQGHIRLGTPSVNESYELTSDEFTVNAWDGLAVENFQAGPGDVSFKVNSTYPNTYDSDFRYVTAGSMNDDLGKPFCPQCSFRPWASEGTVVSALVTVVRADGSTEKVPAQLGTDGRWHAAVVLGEGDQAYVADGDVLDNYGETNGSPSDFITSEQIRVVIEPPLPLI